MDTGKQTGQSAGQAGSEHIQALRGGERSGAAKETAVEHNHDADQEAVDALGSGQSLEKEDAAEAVRVFRKDACARLTGDSDTLGRSGARQCDGKGSAEQREGLAGKNGA